MRGACTRRSLHESRRPFTPRPMCGPARCNNITSNANCINSIKGAGGKLPLLARFSGAIDAQAQWRCYSPSALVNGTGGWNGSSKDYCSRSQQLVEAWGQCVDETTTVLFPFNESGTYAYRIPLLVPVAPAAAPQEAGGPLTIMAFAEARVYSLSDHGPKRIAARRSTDGGATWGPITTVTSDPLGNKALDGLNLGAVVADPSRPGVVHVLYCECAHACSQAGFWRVTSTDGGVTWQAPVNLTSSLVDAQLRLFAPGPGSGVSLPSGRLVVAGWYDGLGSGDVADTGSILFISDDGGETWRAGAKLPATDTYSPNEAQVAVVDAAAGKLLMGSRNSDARNPPSGGCNCRIVATSADAGESFSAVHLAQELLDPVCQGSTISSPPVGGKGNATLYVSNAHDTSSRANGTVFTSIDGGASWQYHATIDPSSFSYSALSPSDAAFTTLGVVWETTASGAPMILRFSTLPALGAEK